MNLADYHFPINNCNSYGNIYEGFAAINDTLGWLVYKEFIVVFGTLSMLWVTS